MPRTVAIKPQGDGQLPASKGTLYTVPTSATAIVKSITVVNTSGSTVKVNIFLNLDGTNSRRIWPKDTELEAGCKLEDDTPHMLDEGDLVEGDAVLASAVDYVVEGLEYTE